MSLSTLPGDVVRVLCEFLLEEERLLLRRASKHVRIYTLPTPWCIRAPYCTRHGAPQHNAHTSRSRTLRPYSMILYAVTHDAPALLDWLQRDVRLSLQQHDLCAYAAAHGATRMLEHLYAQDRVWTDATEEAAARYGHSSVLHLLRQRHGFCLEHALLVALEHGQFALARRLLEQPDDLRTLLPRPRASVLDRDTLLMLRVRFDAWLQQQQPEQLVQDRQAWYMRMASVLCCSAAALGDLPLLEDMLAAYRDYQPETDLDGAAARYGHVAVLEYLVQQYRYVDRDVVVRCAVQAGHMPVLHWVYRHWAAPLNTLVFLQTAPPSYAAFRHALARGARCTMLTAQIVLCDDACDDATLQCVLALTGLTTHCNWQTLHEQASLTRLQRLHQWKFTCASAFYFVSVYQHEQLERLRMPCYDEWYRRVPAHERHAQRAALLAKALWLDSLHHV